MMLRLIAMLTFCKMLLTVANPNQVFGGQSNRGAPKSLHVFTLNRPKKGQYLLVELWQPFMKSQQFEIAI